MTMVALLYVLIDRMPSSGNGIVESNHVGCVDDADEFIDRVTLRSTQLDRGRNHVREPLLSSRC